MDLRLKLTEKINATLAKTQKGGKKLTEKRKAVFVFYFLGFHLNSTEKCNENFGKNRFTLDLTKPKKTLKTIPTTYLLKTATQM